jgi:hypothetical protein
MKFLLNIIALSFVITAYGQQRVEMVSTTEHEAWVSNSDSKVSDAKASPDIKIEKPLMVSVDASMNWDGHLSMPYGKQTEKALWKNSFLPEKEQTSPFAACR